MPRLSGSEIEYILETEVPDDDDTEQANLSNGNGVTEEMSVEPKNADEAMECDDNEEGLDPEADQEVVWARNDIYNFLTREQSSVGKIAVGSIEDRLILAELALQNLNPDAIRGEIEAILNA